MMKFQGTENYVATPDLMLAVNAAMTLKRPLLVKGEPGTGKTMLAEEVAEAAFRALRRPRRVVSVPHWRGAQVRLISSVPDLVLRAAPIFTRLGRAQQDRMRRALGSARR